MNRVLLVDDKEENLYYLEALFKGHGYEVSTARHGAEALVKARQSPPDIVISDLLMPVMDGYTLLRQWKADESLAAIPFIVYTATYTEAQDKQLALGMGADAFILKPAEPDTFLAQVREVQSRVSTTPSDSHKIPETDDSGLMKVYSSTLIRKLEQKSLQLEEANRALQKDIAERIRAEDMLRLLKSAVMQSRESILITDAKIDPPGPQIVFVNPAFDRLTGYTREEAIGMTPRILQGPRTDKAVLQRLRQNLEQGEVFEGEAIQYRKDGSEYVQEWQVAPIRDAGGSVTHYVAIQRDITERVRVANQIRTNEREQRRLAEALEQERARLLAAQRVAKVGSWETDLTNMKVIWSEETYRIHETDPDAFEPTHERFMQLVHPQDRARVDAAFTRSQLERGDHSVEHRLLLGNGRVKYVEERWQIMFDDQGTAVRATGTCQDISERKIAEMTLRESAQNIKRLNRVYALLSHLNALIVRVADRDELFDEACQIAVTHGGYCMAMICMVDKASGRIAPIASAGKDRKLMAAVSEFLTSPQRVPETLVARAVQEKSIYIVNDMQSEKAALLSELYLERGVRSMALLPLMVAGEAVGVIALYAAETGYFNDEQKKLLTDLAGDVAFAIDHIEKQERLDYLAFYDELTGLANRTLLLERVAQYMRGAINHGGGAPRELALFVFDLERFKNVNDTLGHAAGDLLLKQVAQWLCVHAGDASLLARVGSDRFAFVLPEVRSNGNLTSLLEKTMERFQSHAFDLDGQVLHIGAKAGIALFPQDGDTAETLFKNAEAALKKAKISGERYLLFEKNMTEHAATNLAMETQLHGAQSNNEFELYYQPKLSLQSGRVTGTEALMRWNNPQMGLLLPDDFIPMLEETGLIHEVGRWAVRKAISDYLRWCDRGLDAVRIAVNVSPLQLRKRNFANEIEQLVSVDPRAAAGLELEITESMVMEDVEHCIVVLEAIRALGVHVTMDDFGTGFSSLSYLSRLPLDALKIDKSFVRDMSVSPEGVSFVSNIVSLARSINLKVIAEGVESEEQATLLTSLGCDELQGYHFSRPVPRDVFEEKFLAVATPSS
ncbi:MAG: EAL domain-containing protein [Rhodanobacteraceae bacterium]